LVINGLGSFCRGDPHSTRVKSSTPYKRGDDRGYFVFVARGMTKDAGAFMAGERGARESGSPTAEKGQRIKDKG